MGFLDSFTGGGDMDVSAAEDLVARSQGIQKDIYNELSKIISPYLSLGSGSASKLGNYLGVTVPTTSRKELETDQSLINQFLSGTKGTESGRWNKANDDTWTWSGGGDYQFNNAGFQNEIDRIIAEDAAAQAGTEGFGSLLEPFTLEDYEQSPNYLFNLQEGEKALDRAAAAKGNYLSPAAVQDLLEYSQNLASNEYLNSYNMFNQDKQSIYDMFMGTTNVGQNAINQQIPVSTNYASSMTDLNGQLAQLGLADQANEQATRQSAFNNLMSVANLATGGMGGFGGGNMLSYTNSSPMTNTQWQQFLARN